MSRALVVYYSRSGKTRALARAIAAVGNWELEPIVDLRGHLGVGGWLRSSWEAGLGRPTPIAPCQHDPAAYQLVIIGTPVWDFSMSSPIRTWIGEHKEALRTLAFFATSDGHGLRRAFDQMAELAGRQPIATLGLRGAEITDSELRARSLRLVGLLERVLERHPPGELITEAALHPDLDPLPRRT